MKGHIGSIKWEIESRCNLNCKHCFLGNNTKGISRVSYENAIEIVDQLVDYGIQTISFTTLEPLMNDRFCDLVKYCSNKNIFTILLTNGVLLSDLNLAEELIDSGIGMVSISIEGISKNSNDYIRGNGTLDKILQALDNLYKAQCHNNFIQIGLQLTINKYSAQEAKEIPNYVNNLPVDLLQIGRIVEEGNAKNYPELNLSDQDVTMAWEVMMKSYENLERKNFKMINKTLLPFENVFYNIRDKADYMPACLYCTAAENGYSLLPDGSLASCVGLLKNNDIRNETVNIFDFQNKYHIIEESRSAILEYVDKFKNKICNSCYYESYCIPCPAEIFRNGNLDHITNRCLSAQIKIEQMIKNIFLNSREHKISFRKDIFFTIDENTIFLKRYYDIGTISKEKKYYIDTAGISLLKELIESENMHLDYVINKYFNNTTKAKEFLLPLIYDNFISIT